MKKRLLSLGMALCMVLTLVPISAFAEENSEVQTCICEAVCTEESRNTDCPVCGAEGADLEDCDKYVVPMTEMPTEEANTEATVEAEVPTEMEPQSELLVCTCEAACTTEAMNTDCPICGVEGATAESCGKYEALVEETEPKRTAVEKVQALIDALPDADTITTENRADVEAQLTAIDEAKFPLEDEWDALDFTKYNDAIAALNVLDGMGGAEVPETLEDTLQGSGTETDPWILTKEILDSKFTFTSVGVTKYKLDSGMYRLGEDITVTNTIQIADAAVTLDLNGYKLLSTGSGAMLYVVQHTVGATSRLTLVDGSSGKTGEVRNNTGDAVNISENIEFNGNSVPIYGTVTNLGAISGGVFHGKVGGSAFAATITGGTFHGAVRFDGTITGGIFYGAVDAGTINDSAKVTVSFTSDGWTGTQKVLKGQKASTPTRDGCTCTGCYTDSAYTTAFDFDTAITADTTLYAKWYCIGTHVDENPKDHKCDLCEAAVGTHEDADKDHICDYGCAETIGICADADKDHKCDYGCGKSFGMHEDADKDHKCDYGCGKNFGTHEDADKDHICDYGCAEAIGICADADKDHDCDYGCGKNFGTCEDADKDHKCDYGCGKDFGTCKDADKDHKCDYGCGKSLGTHEDADKDYICDYGCAEAIGICADADKDHDCDYGCGKNFGICEDKDKDHKCDYGCDKTFGVCEGGTATCKDKAICDYCGKPYGEVDSSNHVGGTEIRNQKEATCTEDGYTGDTYCKGCDTKLSAGKSVDKTGHDYESKVTKEATTTSTGTKTYTCKNCGHSYEEEIAKLPSQSTSPKTGDETPLGMTIAVTTLSAVALAVLLLLNKKRKVN